MQINPPPLLSSTSSCDPVHAASGDLHVSSAVALCFVSWLAGACLSGLGPPVEALPWPLLYPVACTCPTYLNSTLACYTMWSALIDFLDRYPGLLCHGLLYLCLNLLAYSTLAYSTLAYTCWPLYPALLYPGLLYPGLLNPGLLMQYLPELCPGLLAAVCVP